MKVTDVRVRVIEGDGKLKANADITLDESFVIHGLKVIEGAKGFFVAMPSKRMPSGGFKDIVHPITPELRKELTDLIVNKYKEVYEERKGEKIEVKAEETE